MLTSQLKRESVGINRVLYKHTVKDTISRDDDGAYVVSGNAERMFKMTDFNSDPAVRRFARQMRSMGDDALRERGCKMVISLEFLEENLNSLNRSVT